MKNTLVWFRTTYLSIDLRSLAAGRIALASALLVSLFNRLIELPYFYTNSGLLPNHAVLWSPVYPYELSFFLCLSHSQEALVGFLVCFAAFAALLVGYQTRLAQVASFFCAMSLRNRVPSLLNSGDIVLGLLAFWTMFLPVGRRYSVDAIRARQLQPVSETPTQDGLAVSLAVLALLLQLAAIYALNCVQKDGETWSSGSALHYTLHQDRIVTSFGVWLREHLSDWQSMALTRLTLLIEAIIPLCILSPVLTGVTRRLGALLVVVLHAAFGLCLNLGAFVPAMIAFGVYLVPGKDWDRVAAFADKTGIAIIFRRVVERLHPAGNATPRSPRRIHIPISEIILTVSIVLAGYQLLRENRWFSNVRPPQNAVLDGAVIYLGLFQGWSLFAPDAPKTDLNVSVDAVTLDGRHVDPLNLVASANHKPGLQIPPHLGQSWLFTSYIAHVPTYPQFNSMFIDWIGRYHVRTGSAADRIVSFDAYIVEDDSPPPGETLPTNTRWRRFITHRF